MKTLQPAPLLNSAVREARMSPMAVPKLQERTLGELSQIKVRYFLGPSRHQPYLSILVNRYIGIYPPGSAGNEDAQYMKAMAKAGVAAFEPWGVIHDLSELTYEWGDRLDSAFIGPEGNGEGGELLGAVFATSNPPLAGQPAVVVGPQCEEAVRTLLLGENSQEPVEKVGYVFRHLEGAWDFVEAQLTQREKRRT
jgi:hypothetical protein